MWPSARLPSDPAPILPPQSEDHAWDVPLVSPSHPHEAAQVEQGNPPPRAPVDEMELLLGPDYRVDASSQETGAEAPQQADDPFLGHEPIELPPEYQDRDPYTGLPSHCVPVPGGYMTGGRFIRHVTGTSRVPWIWPEAWQRLGQAARDKLSADWELIQ